MTVGPWTVLSERQLAKSPWLDARAERCVTPSGVIVEDYTVLHYPDWSVAAARTPDGRYVMTRQWRQGAQAISLECAGGVVDEGETPEAAAARELLEETGYAGRYAKTILKVRPNPANQRNWYHVSLFTDCVKVAEPLADETEKLDTLLMTTDDIRAAIHSGELIHGLQVGALLMAFAT